MKDQRYRLAQEVEGCGGILFRVLSVLCVLTAPVGAGVWRQDCFDDFRHGTSDDGGANLYAAADGTVRTIYTFDYNHDGANDILFICGHDNDYAPPSYIYMNQPSGFDPRFRWMLLSEGSSGGTLVDLNGDGWLDAVLCGTSNGTNFAALDSVIYYGAPGGYAKRRTDRVPTNQSLSVAVLDMNADGAVDLAFSQGQAPGVVLYFNSNGRFDPARTETLDCPAASCCRAADVNADGQPDLLVLCGPQLLVYFGTTTGLARKPSYTLETQGGGTFAVADVDGDRHLDLVVANPELDGDAWIYRGDGIGGFRAVDPLAIPSHNSRGVAIADLDRDGIAEVVLANFGRDDGEGGVGTTIHWSDPSDPTRRRIQELSTRFATDVAASDLDHDGWTDLVISCKRHANSHHTNSYVYFNRDGRFSDEERVGLPTMGAVGVTVGDVDRNGEDDLLFFHAVDGTYGVSQSRIYWNDGHGGFSPERMQFLESHDPFGHVAADFNLDGSLDLAIANSYEYGRYREEGSYVYWGKSEEEWSPQRRLLLPTNFAVGVVSADFNKDGWLDLAFSQISQSLDARVTFEEEGKHSPVFWGSAKGFDPKNATWLAVDNPRGLTLGDLNRDGWLDLIYSNITADTIPIFWGSPEGFSSSRRTELSTPGQGSVSINCADLNGDGWLDVLIPCFYDTTPTPWISDRDSYVYWGSPAGFDPARRLALPTQAPTQTAIADFDRDGRLDIFFPNYSNTYKDRTWSSYLYYNGPDGFSAGRRTSLFTNSGSCALPLDFNRDGWLDLVVGCHMTPPGNHRSRSFLFWGGPNGFSDYNKAELPTEGAHELTFVDPGHIYHRRYEIAYTSCVHDAGESIVIGRVSWKGDAPHESSFRFQVRAADSQKTLDDTPWVGAEGAGTFLTASGGRPCEPVRGRFLQYRTLFVSRDGSNYPVLREVAVEW